MGRHPSIHPSIPMDAFGSCAEHRGIGLDWIGFWWPFLNSIARDTGVVAVATFLSTNREGSGLVWYGMVWDAMRGPSCPGDSQPTVWFLSFPPIYLSWKVNPNEWMDGWMPLLVCLFVCLFLGLFVSIVEARKKPSLSIWSLLPFSGVVFVSFGKGRGVSGSTASIREPVRCSWDPTQSNRSRPARRPSTAPC